MTGDKLHESLLAVEWPLLESYTPEQFPLDGVHPTHSEVAEHILWMIELMLEEPATTPESIEKYMRWWGFIQGVLWACNGYSINDLRKQNIG